MTRIMAHYRGQEVVDWFNPNRNNLCLMEEKTSVVGLGKPEIFQA